MKRLSDLFFSLESCLFWLFRSMLRWSSSKRLKWSTGSWNVWDSPQQFQWPWLFESCCSKRRALLKFNKFIDLLLKILFPLSKPCSTGTKLWFRLVSLWNFKVSCHRPWDNLVWIVTSLWLQQCTRCDYVQNIFLVICSRRYKWTGSIKNRYLYINKNVSDVNSHGGMGAEICTVWHSDPGLCSLPSQVIQGLIS